MRRRTMIAVATAATLTGALGAAQAASAATVQTHLDRLMVQDGGSVVNRLTIQRVDGSENARIRVRDTGHQYPTAGPGCAVDPSDPRTVECEGRDTVYVDTAGASDVVEIDPALSGEVHGGSHDDLLVAGRATWPESMAAHAADLAELAQDVSTVRWAGPFGSSTPPFASGIARAWQRGVDEAAAHPAPGVAASGPHAGDLELEGGGNDDVVIGDDGPNRLSGGAGANLVIGGGGDDHLFAAETGVDTFVPGDGRDTLVGAASSSATADYQEVRTTLTADLAAGTVDDADGQPDTLVRVRGLLGGYGRNTIAGSTRSELLVGSSRNDTIDARSGNDLIVGGPVHEGPSLPRLGGDRLIGGAAADAIVTETSDDVVIGGTQTTPVGGADDVVVYGGRTEDVTVDLATGEGGAAGEHDKLEGISAVVGGSGDDVLRDSGTVERTRNLLDGAAGDDRLFAGNGGADGVGDELFGGTGADVFDTTADPGNRLASIIHCGADADAVTAKLIDQADADCERVDRR